MLSRFDFLVVASSAALPRFHRRASIVLRGAVVHDGTGAPGARVDVSIESGRITGIGPGLSGSRVIDLGGLVLAPGFVDIHSHGDGTLDEDGRAESLIRQGITTIVASWLRLNVSPCTITTGRSKPGPDPTGSGRAAHQMSP